MIAATRLKAGCVLLVCSLMILASGCGRPDKQESTLNRPPPNVDQGNNEERRVSQDAHDALTALGYDAELQTELPSRIEFNILLKEDAYSAKVEMPDNWSSLVQEFSDVSQQLTDSLGVQIAFYVCNTQGDTLLTICGGDILYNVFDMAFVPTDNNLATISMDEFLKIQNGMSYQEVFDIVGSAGEIISEVGVSGTPIYTVLYSWDGEGAMGANANVMFQGGIVTNKAQFGLE